MKPVLINGLLSSVHLKIHDLPQCKCPFFRQIDVSLVLDVSIAVDVFEIIMAGAQAVSVFEIWHDKRPLQKYQSRIQMASTPIVMGNYTTLQSAFVAHT
jgi:hypothetical protein